MRAIRRFNVQPTLPPELKGLEGLSKNLRWAWHQGTQQLFRAVDPQLWETVGHDPIKLLSQVPAARMATLAADKRFVRNVQLIEADLHDYMTGDLWFQGFAAENPSAPKAIGYFSAEFGISEVLPQYSGGLGILAGDHLKAASDVGAPIIGVGLLYRHGYFRQSLNASGWQQERYPVLDPNDMPLTQLRDAAGEPVIIEVPLHGHSLKATVWVAQVGRVPLLMMDAGIEANSEADRRVTDRLYGGGEDHRLAQELLLGIGGVRAIREFCRITGHAAPDVFHCNEGHAGFLGLERIREYMVSGKDFETAVELTRAGSVFTTHTPVPAGIDRFPKTMIEAEFANFSPLPLDRILGFGAEDYEGGDPDRFNMAVMGFRLGQRANGVSELHGDVSRRMFQGLWSAFDTTEVPITSVTNGVHHPTWIHPELLEILETSTSNDAHVIDGCDWTALDRVDDETLWGLKRQMRGTMITMARERLQASYQARGMSTDWIANALNPSTLTFGFARRGASYKRLTLMLTDPERLKRLLNHPETPIQIVIAGKSHPADEVGKALIQTMVQFSDQPDVRGKIVFLPDYDMSLAKPLYPGCDVWINNPLRPLEACGTSGMKAALNGAANLSIRDGWWDEWYSSDWGWEIPSAEGVTDPVARDVAEASALYDLIENEVIPRFYTRDAAGLPTRWLKMVRDTVSGLGPKVLASRMVRDYVTKLYTPAAASNADVSKGNTAEQLARWKEHVRAVWGDVRVEHVDHLDGQAVEVGTELPFGANVRLGSLTAKDVEVQLVTGYADGDDELFRITTYPMTVGKDLGNGLIRFERTVVTKKPGSVGYTIRVVPKNTHLCSVAEMGVATVAMDVTP
ncbi:MAG: alpha-glucan family phosphorylase [Propionibacteriaceae bacterium]|nr:alpha-glucan family phosphorylase [Micropruina sp.]HBX80725.1 DUF3417 domain-containing protein [Propionibacteriaceae bacterium]